MKRKWLIGLLSILMVLAMCFGIVACGDSNTEGDDKGNDTEQGGDNEDQGGNTQSDAEIADAAIASLKTLYKDGETASSYKVLGQTKVNGTNYAITWTVTSDDVTNITDYVRLGTMDQVTKQITIDITQGTTEITYKLTASVTVGDVTKTMTVTKTIPAAGKIYTPSEALALGKTITHASGSNETYYAEDGEITAITVKGYVVAIDTSKGGWSDEYKNLNRVYIGDTAETAQADALYVYRIVSDEVYLTGADSIEVGDLVTLNGALEKYYETVELTYCNQVTPSINVTVLGIEKAGEKTDEQVLAAAQNALKLSVSYFSATGDYDLPATVEGASVAWELVGGNNANVKVENGKLTVLNVPDSEASYTLKATLSYGSATSVTKEFPIKVGKLTLTHAGTQTDPYTPAEAIAIAATVAEGEYYSDENGVKGVYVKGKVVDTGSWSGGNFNNYNKIYLIASEDYTREADKDTEGAILVYRIANDSRLTEGSLHHGDELLLLCGIQNYDGTPELGSTQGSSDKVNATTLVEYNPVELTPQDKVDDALRAVNAEITITATGETTLPASTIEGVTFTWSTDTQLPAGITFDSATGKINVTALPEENDVVIVFTLSAACGTEGTGSKTVTVTVKKQGSVPQPGDGLLLTTETLFAGLSKQNSYAVFDGTHTVGSTTVTTDKVMISTSNDYPDTLQFQKSNGTITLSGTFTKIVIVVDTSFDLVNPTVTVGTTSITGTADAGVDHGKTSTDYTIKRYTIEYNIDVAGEQTVTIKTANSSGAMYVPSITLTGTAGSGSQGGGSQGGGGSETPTGTFTPLTEAKTGTFKFALYYGTDKSYYYATGAMSGYYFATSTNLSEAADFVIESVGENQYTIKVGGKYLEFAPRTGKNSKDETKNNEGVNIEMNATQTEGKYWQWVEGIQNFVMESTYNKTGDESATDLYYFGNYGTYTSMSGNFIGRIATGSDGNYTPNNLEGVSQWVAHFGTLETGSTEPETDEKKIENALAALQDKTIDKTTTLETLSGEVTLAWTTDTELPEGITFSGNTITVTTRPDTDTAIVFTVKATLNDATSQKTVTITVKAKEAEPGPSEEKEGFNPLTEAKTGTFKFALYYGTDKSYYYATGNMVKTYYYETTTDVSQAADFVITSVGDNQYTITINGKYLEVVPRTNGSQGVNIAMNATQTEGKYWQWIDGIQNFVMESTYNKTDDAAATDLYYFGNYSTNTSMNVNYISRIATGSDGSYTPNNLEGVSQWVAHFGTLENGSTEPEPENQADQKIAAAKAAILAGQIDLETEYSATNGEGVDLPTENNGATLAWAIKNAQDVIAQVKIEDGKLIIVALPQDADLKVTLVATISCEGASKSDTAEVVITIKKAASTGPVDPSQGKTATFTASEYATQNSWVEYTSYPEITLDENIKASLSTGTNNGKYNYGGWGMYGSEDAVLTITAENGATIVSVKIVYEAKKNGVVCDSEKQTQYPTGSTIPVNASSLTLKITNTDTATNGQAFFTSIEVVYTLGGSTTPGGGDPGTTTPTDGEIVLDFSQALSTFTGSGAGKWNDPYTYGAQSNQLSEINANAPAGTISYSRICAMKVSDGNLIQDRPVLAPNGKQGDANNTVYVTLQLTDKNFSSVSFELKGWSDSKKFDDIHIEYSNDGSEWTACSEKWPAEGTTEDKVSTDGQTFTATSIPANMKYVRLAVSVKETTSTSNKNTQVGLTSVTFKVTD